MYLTDLKEQGFWVKVVLLGILHLQAYSLRANLPTKHRNGFSLMLCGPYRTSGVLQYLNIQLSSLEAVQRACCTRIVCRQSFAPTPNSAIVSVFCDWYYTCKMAIAACKTGPSLSHATQVMVNSDTTDLCCLKHEHEASPAVPGSGGSCRQLSPQEGAARSSA